MSLSKAIESWPPETESRRGDLSGMRSFCIRSFLCSRRCHGDHEIGFVVDMVIEFGLTT